MPASAAYRLSMIFQYISGATTGGGALNLKGGWSESVYWTAYDPGTVSGFQTLAQLRAQCLPAGAYVSGLRFQGIDPSGGANTVSVNYPGPGTTTTNPQDVPQMALLLRVRGSGVTNVRSMRLCAIPDAVVVSGEYVPNLSFGSAIGAFLNQLNGWKFRSQDLAQSIYRIKSIDSNGNVVMIDSVTQAVGAQIKIKRVTDSSGNQKGGKFTVGAITDTTHFQVNGWPFGACTQGTLQPYVTIYPTITGALSSISRVVVRKIGRPSLGYRGRRSRRRP